MTNNIFFSHSACDAAQTERLHAPPTDRDAIKVPDTVGFWPSSESLGLEGRRTYGRRGAFVFGARWNVAAAGGDTARLGKIRTEDDCVAGLPGNLWTDRRQAKAKVFWGVDAAAPICTGVRAKGVSR
jgi:hypothetical protein